MDMNGEYQIAAPRLRVWEALNDPEVLRQCIPGCEEIVKLSDVEWTVQLLQLRHAGVVPALRATSTVAVLRAAVAHALLDPADAVTLEQAWLLAAKVRRCNAIKSRWRRAQGELPSPMT